MLAYVVDAYRRGRSDDVMLIPVSIAYDQIQDVGDYVAEQRGGKKQREGFGWFLGVVRRLRSRFGDIHIRFGEPLSLHAALGHQDPGAEPNADEQSLALQKLAFEVAVRINKATPITPTSLVTMALLGSVDRALTLDVTMRSLENLLHYVERKHLPTTDLALDTHDGVKRALDTLVESGVVSCFDEGPEAVYAIRPDQHATAAYYRNTIIHFFLNGAIVELALLGAAEDTTGDPTAAFWDEAMRLRDLLKFEFFFAEKDVFRAELRDELALHDPAWDAALAEGGASVQALLRRVKPFSAHRVLRPFLEAYRVVADALARDDGQKPLDDNAFIAGCIKLGKQYELMRRVHSGESVSKVLFATALRLAKNRGLLETDRPDLAERRAAFAAEIRTALRRVDAIDALAAGRRAGLVD
jgi:glycerol-3-phosphate O-acyltransferase